MSLDLYGTGNEGTKFYRRKNVIFSLDNDELRYRAFYTVILAYYTETLYKHPHVHKSFTLHNLFLLICNLVQNVLQP